jgi:LysM repeat protein
VDLLKTGGIMRKALAIILSVCLLFTMGIPGFALGKVDAVTASTHTPTAPATNYTPVATYTVPEGSMVHVVVAGDVMWKIAQKHGLTLAQIAELNPWITNLNKIRVGQQIVVKAATSVTTPVVDEKPVVTTDSKLYLGLGTTNVFRARGTNYSFNMTSATAIFDGEGRIVSVFVDTYEISQAANFPGWPGTSDEFTLDSATALVSAWESKRDKGDSYNMKRAATSGNEWYVQMDNFQEFFKGKTVAEIRTWFDKTSAANGKPINPATATDEKELAKLALLTPAEKAELADVVSGATMSLSDNHSLIIEAIEEAYANRVPVN